MTHREKLWHRCQSFGFGILCCDCVRRVHGRVIRRRPPRGAGRLTSDSRRCRGRWHVCETQTVVSTTPRGYLLEIF
eukprot:3226144-Prymnesium_polylepis.1